MPATYEELVERKQNQTEATREWDLHFSCPIKRDYNDTGLQHIQWTIRIFCKQSELADYTERILNDDPHLGWATKHLDAAEQRLAKANKKMLDKWGTAYGTDKLPQMDGREHLKRCSVTAKKVPNGQVTYAF